MDEKIHIWSVPLKPIRKFAIPFDTQRKIVEFIPWTERLFRLPVHTFATIDEEWKEPPKKNIKEGYWYCAGDFCSTSEDSALGLKVEDANSEFAKCLVKPDIKKGEPEHNMEVIGGAYIIDYVCHNITNRILYSASTPTTLANTPLPLTGYKAVVNSPLGLYGRQTREWSLIVEKCRNSFVNEVRPDNDPKTNDTEIERIHQRAANDNPLVGRNITDALLNIDTRYSENAYEIYNSFDEKMIGIEDLNNKMENLLRETIANTERIIGPNMAKRIYGDYSLGEDSTDSTGTDSSGNDPEDSGTQQTMGEA